MRLYDYFRSTAAYRVRIALNFKGIGYERREVHLVRDGGEHRNPEYRAVNPQMRVPALMLDDGTVLTQSPAILEWLEERFPSPTLLPGNPEQRARIRALAAIVACDIHPINNLAVLTYLKAQLAASPATVSAWYRHWIETGFTAIERMVGDGGFCVAGQPTMADVALVPQVYNARRFEVPLDAFPKIAAIERTCLSLAAFAAAAPDTRAA